MQKLEIFNEITNILLVYSISCFSSANVAALDNEFPLDVTFMLLLSGNLCVHIYFLVKDTCVSSKRKCKKAKCCCLKKKDKS